MWSSSVSVSKLRSAEDSLLEFCLVDPRDLQPNADEVHHLPLCLSENVALLLVLGVLELLRTPNLLVHRLHCRCEDRTSQVGKWVCASLLNTKRLHGRHRVQDFPHRLVVLSCPPHAHAFPHLEQPVHLVLERFIVRRRPLILFSLCLLVCFPILLQSFLFLSAPTSTFGANPSYATRSRFFQCFSTSPFLRLVDSGQQ